MWAEPTAPNGAPSGAPGRVVNNLFTIGNLTFCVHGGII